jgi:hypothetical protein
MSIPSKQIGQSAESNLLWQISKQLEWINNNTGYNTGTFVPYVGATSAVNLGTQTLISGSITVGYDSIGYHEVLNVVGSSRIYGTELTDGAVYSGELLTVASGTGWTGTDFASGYTHVSGVTPLIATSPAPGNGYYQLNYTIYDRTVGEVAIRFGDLFEWGITESGSITSYSNSVGTYYNLTITPSGGFNGTIVASLVSISECYPLITLYDSLGSSTNQIKSVPYNFIMGLYAAPLIQANAAYSNYCLGNGSGRYLTTGSSNIFVGESAGRYTSTGNGNIAIGSTGNRRQSGNNTIAIGGSCNGDDIIQLGDGSMSTISIGANQGSIYSTTIGNSSITSTIIYGNLLLGGTANRNAILDVTGPSLQNGNIFFAQPAPIAKTASATLLISELLTGIITATSATAVSLALPSATLTNAGILGGLLPIDNAFDWVVINRGSSVGIVTITNGSGNTMFGLTTIPIASQAIFRTRKTATNTFITYRIA